MGRDGFERFKNRNSDLIRVGLPRIQPSQVGTDGLRASPDGSWQVGRVIFLISEKNKSPKTQENPKIPENCRKIQKKKTESNTKTI
jgi:hypothetical protein